jgi:hypothetical protein
MFLSNLGSFFVLYRPDWWERLAQLLQMYAYITIEISLNEKYDLPTSNSRKQPFHINSLSLLSTIQRGCIQSENKLSYVASSPNNQFNNLVLHRLLSRMRRYASDSLPGIGWLDSSQLQFVTNYFCMFN